MERLAMDRTAKDRSSHKPHPPLVMDNQHRSLYDAADTLLEMLIMAIFVLVGVVAFLWICGSGSR